MHIGSCLCGAVKFTVEGELKPPDACHCTQCRKTSGHYWAATNVSRSALKIDGEFVQNMLEDRVKRAMV